ncbi:hypothetical protein CLI64_21520 [Nostoc sp. CENA543]|uniref:hypothetical protein n=1 Tax=Nostoc sp. CENA543 TaxID=1869241 RepID=UPI000CA2E204|nr:hypothetical protein [Nostoc sp. CENA543]AUT02768.1 hypothetical protein CLI64_21520 [Nostoc sp. CENA543]
MDSSKHSDIEIEVLLIGKWRFNTSLEKVTIEFKDDMTYEEIKIQTSLFYKAQELITGNKFTGVWYVTNKKLHLNVKAMPKSVLNFKIPLAFKISIADAIASINSVFTPEIYDVMRINNSQFLIKYQDESIIGAKINPARR